MAELTSEQQKYFREQIARISGGIQTLYKQRGMTAPPQIGAITPQSLQPPQLLTLPSAPTSTAVPALQGWLGSFLQPQNQNRGVYYKQGNTVVRREEEEPAPIGFTLVTPSERPDLYSAQKTPEVSAAEKATSSQLEEIKKTMQEIQGIPATQARLEQEAGIPGLAETQLAARKQATSYRVQLAGEEAALRKQIEEIQKNPQGKSAGAIQSEVSDAQRVSLSKQADISLLQLSAQAEYENTTLDLSAAQSIIDKKIKLITEPLEQKLKWDEFIYQENKDIWTKAEARQLEQMKTQDQRLYTYLKDELKSVHDTYIKAVENNAPESVKQAILASQSSFEATQAAGKWLRKPAAPIRGATLSMAEAIKYGLPLTLVGRDEAQIASSLYSPEPAQWFQQFVQIKSGGAWSIETLRPGWERFRYDILGKIGKVTTKSGLVDFDQL